MRLTIVLTLLLTFITTQAQSSPADTTAEKKHEFTLRGELMTRGEVRDGALSENESKARFILERTRLSFNYKQPHLEVQITPQHSGVWGTSGGGSFSMREAWAKVDGAGLFAKIGRQSLTYDDERVIGLDDWSMTSAYHDALKVGYEGHGHKVHAVFAYNQNDGNINGGTDYYNGGQVYKTMQMLWYHYDFLPNLGASALFLNTGLQSPQKSDGESDVINQQLFGVYAKFAPKNFSFEGSYYRQTGHTELNMPIKAWMGSVEGNWDINPQWKTNVGYFHLSGDENYYYVGSGAVGLALQTEAHAFNLIFASHHQFYGAMDFFYLKAFYGGYSPGLQDLHGGVQFSPISKLNFGLKYHVLNTSIKVKDLNRFMGHELELSASWKILKEITLSAGYSFMKGTETMKMLERTDDDTLHWGWIMLVVKPKFFSTSW